MSDFFQNGTVTTLHNLKTRTLESLEAELHQFAEHSPMALILPCLYSELAQNALREVHDCVGSILIHSAYSRIFAAWIEASRKVGMNPGQAFHPATSRA